VKNLKHRAGIVAAMFLLLVPVGAARAEDVERRLRLSFAVGGYDTQDDIPSDAANILTIIRPDGEFFAQYEDPRSDNAQLGTLGIKPALRWSLGAQYAFTKLFLVEGSIGYQKGDVGEIEVQGQFAGDIWDTRREPYNFHSYRQPGGEMTQVPIQLTGMMRFRPKATFNPYAGLGIGYTFVGFTPSQELDELSKNLDEATGSFSAQFPSPGGFGSAGPAEPLTGAVVEAPDTFEWHAAGGFEWTVKKKWAIFVDLRYIFASSQFRLGFNGGESLGVSVPNGEKDQDSPEANTVYGTYDVPAGLLDVGCLVPIAATTTQPCAAPGQPLACNPNAASDQPDACKLQFTPDGQKDRGLYYVKGGSIKYGGPNLQIGVRYTF
jgi:opacity protein-like surface antigen